MYQAAFFDIDGTLYDHKRNCISQKHFQALKEFQEKGIKVCLCSGRDIPLIENLNILTIFPWDGIVGGNGSYVYDKDLNLLLDKPIDPSIAKKIFELGKERNVPILGCGTTVFATKKDDYMNMVLDRVHITCIERELQEEDRFSLISWCHKGFENDFEIFKEIDGITPLTTPISVDMHRKGVSKAKGIQFLMRHFGFEEDNYIAFGDAMNDLEMLEGARLGVAMKNSDPRLLERIQEVAPSVYDDGIYVYLKEKGIL